MNYLKLTILLACFFSVSTPVSAGDTLTGRFYFTEENCGTDAKNQRCNLSFEIDGEAA